MIVTVYSYKPEVGCTMMAVNVAIALSRESAKRVLLVDWHFAAPKALLWLKEISDSPAGSLVDLLTAYKELIDGELPITADLLPKCADFVNSTSIPGLDYLPATLESGIGYSRLTSFDWVEFYRDYRGGAIVEHLRKQWAHDYDVVVVISDKGISDAASVCTIQVADIIMVMMSMNVHEIEASLQVVRVFGSIELKKDGRRVKILPVPSRIEPFEAKLRFELREKIREGFWKHLPSEIDGSAYFEEVQIPYASYYSYKREIAMLHESRDDRLSISQVYRALTRYLLGLTNQEAVEGA